MLSLNPTSLTLDETGRATPFRIATMADVCYTPHDLTVKVTVLPSHGTVLKEDGITQVGLGQIIAAGELAALKFMPGSAQTGFAAGTTIEPRLESWSVLSVPQNGEPGLKDRKSVV